MPMNIVNYRTVQSFFANVQNPETSRHGEVGGSTPWLKPSFGLAVNTHRSSPETTSEMSAALLWRKAYVTTGQTSKRKPTHMASKLHSAATYWKQHWAGEHNTMHLEGLAETTKNFFEEAASLACWERNNGRVHDFTTAGAGKGRPANLDGVLYISLLKAISKQSKIIYSNHARVSGLLLTPWNMDKTW